MNFLNFHSGLIWLCFYMHAVFSIWFHIDFWCNDWCNHKWPYCWFYWSKRGNLSDHCLFTTSDSLCLFLVNIYWVPCGIYAGNESFKFCMHCRVACHLLLRGLHNLKPLKNSHTCNNQDFLFFFFFFFLKKFEPAHCNFSCLDSINKRGLCLWILEGWQQDMEWESFHMWCLFLQLKLHPRSFEEH